MLSPLPLSESLAPLSLHDRLDHAAGTFVNPVFTTSLGLEDQLVTGVIAEAGLPIRIVTLDTGRLYDETVALIGETETRFGIAIERFSPDASDVEAYRRAYGIDGFYDSVEARHACCGFRKLKPLARALDAADCWITGLRRGQSANRGAVPFAEHDPARDLVKVNPLADWSIDQVRDEIERRSIPVNPLHERGYPSIGCAPCTRAIRPGEPERAGRWWWEQSDARECGLHPDRQAGEGAAA